MILYSDHLPLAWALALLLAWETLLVLCLILIWIILLSQSKLDPCLFIGNKVIYILNVDNLLFWSKGGAHIHDLAILLHQVGMTWNMKMMLQDFLM